MPIYNKLVRDKIPEIISSTGKTPHYHVLNETEYLIELDRKLNEECSEYQADKSIEELADMLEVMYAICEARGYSAAELERCQKSKANSRGKFSKRIYLESVDE